MRQILATLGIIAIGICAVLGCAGCGGDDDSSPARTSIDEIDWIASVDLRVGVSSAFTAEVEYLTDSDLDEYKPTYSPDGSKIVFFRTLDYGNGQVYTWKTQVFVMNTDGTGVKQLTGGDFMDFNPMWTRDGSDRITFTRFEGSDTINGVTAVTGMGVYWTSPDSEVGEEQLLSNPNQFTMGYSSLVDGRMLVRVELLQQYYLMTPNPGEVPLLERLSYPFENTLLHKMSISPSETKVAYMKVEGYSGADVLLKDTYGPAVIAYADFDADNLAISNEVVVSEYDKSTVSWYTSWSPKEDVILYAHSGTTRAYDLNDGTTTKISADDTLEYRYPSFLGTVK